MTIQWLGTPVRGSVGQITPGEFNFDVFTIQALINDSLVQRNQTPIREDGIIDQATCLRVAEAASGAITGLDPRIGQLIADNQAALQAVCATPPPAPPPQVDVPGEFEQCFIDFNAQTPVVATIQTQVNNRLRLARLPEIQVTGVYDEATCRAVLVAEQIGGPEWNLPQCPGGVSYPTTCPGTGAPQAPTAGGAGGGGLGLAALIAAVAIGVGYLVTQS